MPSFLNDFDNSDLLAIALASCMCVLVMWSLRRRIGTWLIPTLAFIPVPVVALFSREFDLVGWHGFMHASPIYRILDGGPLPPEEPLFAGGSLRYPWIEHWIVAHLVQLSGANVHVMTLSIEIIAYAAFLAGGCWLASTVSDDTGAIALGVLFTGFGISIFHVGLLLEPFERAFPELWLESRVVPLDKFANISAMPLGYASLAIAAAAGVRLAAGMGRASRLSGVVAACTLVAALVHPLSWACLVCFQSVVLGVLVLARTGQDYRRAAWLATAVAVPCLIALPYLRSVGISESGDGWSGLTSTAALGWAKVGDAAVFLAPLALLAYVQRASLWRMLREGNRPLAIVLLAIPCLAGAYIAIRFPGRNEYKFLLCLVLPAAPLLGICLRALSERHFLLTGLFVFALLTPGTRALGVRPWFQVTDPCGIDGPYLRSLNPANDQIYQYIASETPRDAVFISADLGIPPLGRRALYIPVDSPWLGRDGWGLETYKLREWHVRRPEAEMRARQRRAEIVMSASWDEPASSVMSAIQAEVPNRSLFVYTRNGETIAKLDHTAGFIRRFQNRAGAIYAAFAPELSLATP
jgi:hypothetical protein